MKNNLLIKLIVILGVVVIVLAWVINYLFLSGKAAPKSQAAGETITIAYDNAALTIASGSDLTVLLRITPSANIYLRGYTVKLKFDPSVLQAKYIDYRLGVPSPSFGNTSSDLGSINATGTINVQGEIQNSTGLLMAGSSTVDLVRLVFTAKSASGTTVAGTNGNIYYYPVTGNDGTILVYNSTIPDLKINGGAAAATCTSFSDNFTGTALNSDNWTLWTNNDGTTLVGTGSATLNLPASTDGTSKGVSLSDGANHSVNGGDYSAEIVLNSVNATTNEKKYVSSGFALQQTTDDYKTLASISRYSDSSRITGGALVNGTWVSQDVDIGLTNNTPVKVKIEKIGTTVKTYYDIMDGKGYQLIKQFDNVYNAPKTNVYFTVANGSTDFPQGSAKFSNFVLTCAGTGTGGSISPTPGGTVTGNVRLNLKLKFQGIGKQPASGENSMTVAVKVKQEGANTSFITSQGTFTADNNGVWSGTVGFNISDVSGKWAVYVKGPQHIQKKICDGAPTESSPGVYNCSNGNINLAAGDNSFDFSKIVLLSGDLNQDGVVDSVDLGMVRNNLGKKDADTLKKADINRDGVVDTQDFSLILSALSVRTDQL